MLDQNSSSAKRARQFHDLFLAVTADPAMLVWLNGERQQQAGAERELRREMMELFSLGADRGAYTETTSARWRARYRLAADWRSGGLQNFRFDPRHDGDKTVFGQTGNWNYADAVRLCVTHPAARVVLRAASCGATSSRRRPTGDARALETCTSSGYTFGPVVEAILRTRTSRGPRARQPPVVYNARLLRAIGRPIDTTAWACPKTPKPQNPKTPNVHFVRIILWLIE